VYDFFKQMSETNHTVLILDDDHILAKMMADFLVISAHCTVDLTLREVDFWTAYHAKQYDLIFMDYRLTEITGLEILEKLSKIGNKIPVVMMTAKVLRRLQ
jgi:DNA-binding NtrC family response regulator